MISLFTQLNLSKSIYIYIYIYMAIAFNIFIFGSSPNLVAADCSNCSNSWTTDISSTFETKINYYIPSDFTGQAELLLTNEKGNKIIQKLDACIGKPCSITISANGLNTGVYIYALILDGQILKSKKLMIMK